MAYQGLKNSTFHWKKTPKQEGAFFGLLHRADSEKLMHLDWIPRPRYDWPFFERRWLSFLDRIPHDGYGWPISE